MRTLLALVLLPALAAAQSFTPVREQKNLSPAALDTVHILETLNALPAGEWRFHAGDIPHGESPALDDTAWPLVAPATKGHPSTAPKSAVWYRRTIEVPTLLHGYDLTGARIWFQFLADANGPMPEIIYVNGTRVALGDDLEPIVLFPHARPGEKLLVAVKLLHTVDDKSFQGVNLRIEPASESSSPRPDPDDIRQQIITAANLLPALPTPRTDLLPVVEQAAAAIDLKSLAAGNQPAFDNSLRKAQQILTTLHQPLATVSIDLTGNSHIDAAWLWPRSETIDVVRRTFTTALQLMDEYPNYTYTQSAAQYSSWMADKYPDLNAQIAQRIKEGRWEIVGGMWVEPDLNLPGGESLVRQLLVGQREFQKLYGVTARIGWNPDSFGYNWQLPQIYKRSGLDYFVTQKMHWNDTNTLPFRLFWWQSPDGSKVLTYFPTDYVHVNLNPTRISADFAESAQRNPGLTEHLDLYGVGDHGGGPTRAMLDAANHWITLSNSGGNGSPEAFRYPEPSGSGLIAPEKDLGLQPLGYALPTFRNTTAQQFFTDIETHLNPNSPIWNYDTIAKGYTPPPTGKLENWQTGKPETTTQPPLPTPNQQPQTESQPKLAAGSSQLTAGEQPSPSATNQVSQSLSPGSHSVATDQVPQGFSLGSHSGDKKEGVGNPGLQPGVSPPLIAIPTWNSELYFEYHRGVFTTQAAHKRNMRQSETQTLDAEKLASLAWLQGDKYPADVLTENWKKITFNQFHDLAAGSGIAVIYRDAADDYAQVFNNDHNIDAASLNSIGIRIDTSFKAGAPIFVFNPMAWRRSETVRFTVQLSEPAEKIRIADADDRRMYAQVVSHVAGTNLFDVMTNVEDIPAFGYTVLHVTADKSDEEPKGAERRGFMTASMLKSNPANYVISSAFADVTIDKRSGCITSLRGNGGNANGIEFLATNACANQLQTYADNPKQYDAWNIDPGTLDGKMTPIDTLDSIKVIADGPLRKTIEIQRTWQHSHFTQDISLDAGADFVRVDTTVDWHEDHVLLKAAFPLAHTGPKATFEIPFGAIERPTTRNNTWEQAQFEVPALRWADLGDATAGVSILNDSKYGYDALGNTLRLTLLRSPTWPDPAADRGPQHFTYEIYPHTGPWQQAQTVHRAYELNTPLTASQVFPHTGSLPSTYSFASVDEPNIILSAIKKAEDAPALIVRLYDATGQGSTAHLHLPPGALYAVETNLMEAPLPNAPHLPVTAGTVTLPVHPWEIRTLEIMYPETH